jgi:hypothetical protein
MWRCYMAFDSREQLLCHVVELHGFLTIVISDSVSCRVTAFWLKDYCQTDIDSLYCRWKNVLLVIGAEQLQAKLSGQGFIA